MLWNLAGSCCVEACSFNYAICHQGKIIDRSGNSSPTDFPCMIKLKLLLAFILQGKMGSIVMSKALNQLLLKAFLINETRMSVGL